MKMNTTSDESSNSFQVETFIDMVRQNRCLYVLADPDYKKNRVKDDIWSQIGEHMGIVGTDTKAVIKEAKRRWKNLRDTFRDIKRRLRDIKRRRKSKMGGAGGSEAMKEWAFSEHMSFLDDSGPNRETDSSIPPIETNGEKNIEDDLDSDIKQTLSMSGISTSTSRNKKSWKSASSVDDLLIDLLQKNRMEREQAMIMEDDELKKFFESQYLATSKLSHHRQRQVKKEIIEIINHQEEEHELEAYISTT